MIGCQTYDQYIHSVGICTLSFHLDSVKDINEMNDVSYHGETAHDIPRSDFSGCDGRVMQTISLLRGSLMADALVDLRRTFQNHPVLCHVINSTI